MKRSNIRRRTLICDGRRLAWPACARTLRRSERYRSLFYGKARAFDVWRNFVISCQRAEIARSAMDISQSTREPALCTCVWLSRNVFSGLDGSSG